MGEGQAWVPFSEVNCRLGLSQRRLVCRGWISMDSSYHPALQRRSRRTSLPTGPCAIPLGPQTWLPEFCPSAAASVWKLDQNSVIPPASSPSFAGSGNRSWGMVIVWIFFLQLCVKNRLCPGRRSEGGRGVPSPGSETWQDFSQSDSGTPQ